MYRSWLRYTVEAKIVILCKTPEVVVTRHVE